MSHLSLQMDPSAFMIQMFGLCFGFFLNIGLFFLNNEGVFGNRSGAILVGTEENRIFPLLEKCCRQRQYNCAAGSRRFCLEVPSVQLRFVSSAKQGSSVAFVMIGLKIKLNLHRASTLRNRQSGGLVRIPGNRAEHDGCNHRGVCVLRRICRGNSRLGWMSNRWSLLRIRAAY